jgi:PAS domain S-box-containing protein
MRSTSFAHENSLFGIRLQFLLPALIFVLLSITSPAHALEQITLQLKWLHQFQFAGYYAAEQQGYYRDAGLNVTIKAATPGKDPVLDVIDGKAEYGVGTSSLLLLRNAGKPVVALAVIFQHSPFILLTKEQSASQTIHTLIGKRLMLEPQSDELVAYLKKEGIPLEKMQLVEHSFNIKDLMYGNVDVMSGYVTDDPDVLDRAGFVYHAYTPRSAGIDFYGDNLFTTESELNNNPARVKAFREASLKGWHYALENQDEIIDLIIKKYAPKSNRSHLKYEAEQVKQLIQPNLVEVGYMHTGRWQHIADTYRDLGMLEKKVDFEQFMYDPHPQQDRTALYRIAAAFLGVVIFVIIAVLFKMSRNLLLSEEKFSVAFKNAPLMKTIFDMESGKLLDVNAKFCEVTGYSKEFVIGKHSAEVGILTPDDRQKLTDALVRDGRFSGIKLKVHTATGAVLECVYYGELVKVGKKQQLLCDILDVTEHRRAEEQIRKLSQAVEQSPATIVITDTHGNIEFVNPKFTELTGYTFDEVKGKNPRILKAEGNPPELYKKLWRTITAGKIWEGEFYNRKKNGELFWERAAISPLRNADGVVTHFLGIKEDVTEQKKVREQLLQSQKIEAIGQLTGGLAHDFNNILSVIGGYANLLQMRMAPNDPNRDKLQHILTATEKAGNLTHSLLAFSRKQIMKPENVNLNTIIFQFGAFIKRVIGENIAFKTSIGDETLYVHVDRGQIEQVLINLATNARDAMPDGGILNIETGQQTLDAAYVRSHGEGSPGHYAVVSVSDTGIGMDEKTRNMIFEPFFTTKEVGKGTGLGMAMVYGIVKQHNGFITVYSEPGHGTVFRILLPLIENSDETSMLPVDQTLPPLGSETVLVVEDEPILRQLTQEILLMGGYEVLLAGDGKEAVRIFAENRDRIGLIIMDMIMPVMGGKEAAEEIRKIEPAIRVLFCSGYSLEMLQSSNEPGVITECISKPVQPRELLKKVREVLDRK